MSNRELDYGNVSKMLAEAREMQETGKYINGTVYHTLADEVERLQALIYIINTGHTATIAGFDDDHDPIGPTLRKKLVPRYLSEHSDGRLRLTGDGMELAMDSKYGRR